MARNRKFLFLGLFLIAAAAVAVVAYQRIARPSRAVLLLPEADLVLYANFAPVPFVNVGQFVDIERLPAQSDPKYQDFVRQTNFHADHDLAEIAIAIAHPGDPTLEFSAVLTGTFDQARLESYLPKLATARETYAGKTIFSIQPADHAVRICIVDGKTVAVTNTQSADAMHAILDHTRGAFFFGQHPPLLRDYYHYVPFGSLAWAILRVPAQVSSSSSQLPGGLNMDFLRNAVTLVSVRYAGTVFLRAEVVSANETDAAHVLESANTLLVLRAAAADWLQKGGPDKDVKDVFNSIHVEQKGVSTQISVTLSQAFLQKLAANMNR